METLLLGLVLLWSLYTAFAKLAPRSFAALAERMARWCGVERPLSSDGRAGRQPNACGQCSACEGPGCRPSPAARIPLRRL